METRYTHLEDLIFERGEEGFNEVITILYDFSKAFDGKADLKLEVFGEPTRVIEVKASPCDAAGFSRIAKLLKKEFSLYAWPDAEKLSEYQRCYSDLLLLSKPFTVFTYIEWKHGALTAPECEEVVPISAMVNSVIMSKSMIVDRINTMESNPSCEDEELELKHPKLGFVYHSSDGSNVVLCDRTELVQESNRRIT